MLCYGFSCWWGWQKIDNSQKGGNGFLFYDDCVNIDKYFTYIPEKVPHSASLFFSSQEL
jgi:hypothetical protein